MKINENYKILKVNKFSQNQFKNLIHTKNCNRTNLTYF